MNHPAVDRRLSKTSLAAAVLVSLGIGCSKSGSSGEQLVPRRVSMAPDVVAMVGDSRVSRESFERALQMLHEPTLALTKLIEARLYGAYAASGGLEAGRLRMTKRAVLGRALLERIEQKTRAPATPTDAEVQTMTARRWIEFDRAEAVTTCHAIVHAEGLDELAGLALARRLAEALRPIARCEEFLAVAKAFPVAGAKITAERLPPVTPEGRTIVLDPNGKPVDEGATFDEQFARAAHQLRAIGEQSGIVRTSFGWHIILLESRLPAKRVPLELRRETLAADILRQRAKDASDGLLAECRQRTPVIVERSAVETVGQLQVSP